MLALHGTGVGAGIAIGKARVISRQGEKIAEYTIADDVIEDEVARLRRGISEAKGALEALRQQYQGEAPDEVLALLEAHGLMLNDPMIGTETAELIRGCKVNAEFALSKYSSRMQQLFGQIKDPYLSAKSADVAQVVQRILAQMMDAKTVLDNQPEGAFDDEIIIANDLTPADTIALRKHRIIGFLTNLGGPISHTAILARSMKIPAIVGLHGATRFLNTGDQLVIDGKRGVILADPDQRALAAYQQRRRKIVRRNQALETLRDAASVSLDGARVKLYSNIELPGQIAVSERQNADGVGLYRTEFLFMNRQSMPDEAEQVAAYTAVLGRKNQPVTIRTLDLGADKQVDGGRVGGLQTINPALGLRAIRLCLHDIGLFKPQLRAIYRASAFGNVKIMAPMLSTVEELNQLFRLLEEVQLELAEQGHPFKSNIPVGGMIEVPAAAIAADIFADKLDFLSIGTNDLIQYTLAIDRVDDAVNYLYDPLHPSILRLIKVVLDAGINANIPVSMCGEMAGDPAYTRILLALGLREFSMDPVSLLEVKQRIRMSDIGKLEAALPAIMQAVEPDDLRHRVQQLNQ